MTHTIQKPDQVWPKAAVFLARKLFCDYAQLVNKKIELILNQDTKDKPIFKSLQRNEDLVYDQLLDALAAVSEFCLPSLLNISLSWYHHQLGYTDDNQHSILRQLQTNSQPDQLSSPQTGGPTTPLPTSPVASLASTPTTGAQVIGANNCDLNPFASIDCVSPGAVSNDLTLTSLSSPPIMIRTPTPSSPEMTLNQTQQIITSTSHLDYQSPTSLTVIGSLVGDPQLSTSAANTSTSTATNVSSNSLLLSDDSTSNSKRTEFVKSRRMLIEYCFCQLLIEIFQQLNLHPGHEELINQIEDIAFNHFKYDERNELNNSNLLAHMNQVVDKYAEVVGVLAHSRFRLVKKRVLLELNELRSREPTPANIQGIVKLLLGVRHFRVKMAPIEEFEASFQFLQELADYFIETRHKSIKHSLAVLFVEILLPLASTVKNEVKIPCLKNFVDSLWSQTWEMSTRKKHSITLFPLVTCLLCLSQKTFFLANWGQFLNTCLSNLKNRDQKMCRVALESLYRLIWIYMIRVKCESNNVTQTRLHSIIEALFPRSSRTIMPRDTPLDIFVDIIQFIAQERLDFAMRDIIFDLLSVDRPPKIILAPERMSIALQAFVVIADTLQQKEGTETSIMPRPSGCTLGVNNSASNVYNKSLITTMRKRHTNKMLSDDMAKSIGINQYHGQIQKAFSDILKALDSQYGKPLLKTARSNNNKEPDEVITSDRRPKIELFKVCIAAIPRLVPQNMSKAELVDLLSRMTVHLDEEMRKLACESLQTLVTDYPDWRLDAIEGFTSFMISQIDDSHRQLLDASLKTLQQMLVGWRHVTNLQLSTNGSSVCACDATQKEQFPQQSTYGDKSFQQQQHHHQQHVSISCCPISIQTGFETIGSRNSGHAGSQIVARRNRALGEMRLRQSELSNMQFDRLITVIQKVEAAGLMLTCNRHQPTRRLAGQLLRESRAILKCYLNWYFMEQSSFKSPDGDVDDEDLSTSIRGSLSADNLSRITALSASCAPIHSSATSINTQNAMATSISKVCMSSGTSGLVGGYMATSSAASRHLEQTVCGEADVDNTVAEGLAMDNNSSLLFWIVVIMLESDRAPEYQLALNLLHKILPNLPLEQPEFLDELAKSLSRLDWKQFPNMHGLILKGCTSGSTYESSIALLDLLTPILKHPICCSASSEPGRGHTHCAQSIRSMSDALLEDCFVIHVIILALHLLSNYEEPSAFSLNMARRLSVWCEENSKKLDNLGAVLTLYSRRSFSKDAFQWTKCVVKYLHDAYPTELIKVVPFLIELVENRIEPIHRVVAPVLYCILNYMDLTTPSNTLNQHLDRLYTCYLGSCQWREIVQIIKLVVSRSSTLITGKVGGQKQELPGRTLDFELDMEQVGVIAKNQLPNLESAPAVAS